MKKKNKVLLTSMATIAMCASLVAGGTYALFTSESVVNIAVSSGTVDVTATASDATVTSVLGTPIGTANVDNNTVTLTNIVPGDTVTFKITVTNNSNVAVNYRTVIKCLEDTGLMSGLQVTFDDGTNKQTFTGSDAYADWAKAEPGEGNKEITVSITLPKDAGDEYQSKFCKLAYTVEAVQGNAEVENPIDYNAEENVYYVNNETGMMLMNNYVNTVSHGEGRALNFALNDNMDMTGYDWTPIPFHWVTLDGKGFTVSNLDCGFDNSGRSGFAGYAGGCVMENLTLKNVTARGTQAGVVAGSLEGATLTNVTIAGANSVTFDQSVNPVETWGGVGAVAGVSTAVKNSNVTIAEGATISVAYNDILTESAYANEYAFINDISAYVTNSGTISTTGTWGIYLADGLYQMADGTYKITNANGLVTAGASYFSKGGTFNLANSVTLSDELWIPAKVGKNFTFNGNENTISNLNVADPAGSTNGMGAYSFLLCADGVADDTTTVKNVIFDGAKITGNGADNANMAVVLTTTRQHYYSTLVMENVKVQNSVLKNGDRTGGLLAYGDSEATITMTNCASNNNTIESKGTAGALIAFTNFATTTINGFEAKNNTISSSEGEGKAGLVIGTASGATTVTVNDLDEAIAGSKAINAGVETNNVAGRMANTDTIKSTMTVNGAHYVVSTEYLGIVLSSSETEIDILLGNGNYMNQFAATNKTVNVKGGKGAIVGITEDYNKVNYAGDWLSLRGCTFTFDGVTMEFEHYGYYIGYTDYNKITYNNCQINGRLYTFGETEFNNCKLDAKVEEHCVWTYGAAKVSFNGCEFTYGDRCVNVYTEAGITTAEMSFTGCKFNYTKTENDSAFGAVEINDRSYKTSVNVTMTGCTAPTDGEMVYLSSWRSDGDVIATVVVNGTAIAIPQEPKA